MRAELAVDCRNSLGEGTFYDIKEDALWWVDIAPPSFVYRLNVASGEVSKWPMPEMISYAVPRAGGGMLLVGHGGLHSFDPASGATELLRRIETTLPFNRSNDSCCDPKGNLWAGTMQNNIAPDLQPISIVGASGGLYRIDAKLAVQRKVADVAISNSCCFSPSGELMYFCDTPQKVIWSYDIDLDSGELGARRDLATYERGGPDGATVDSDGCIWSTRYGGGCVVRFTPAGKVDAVVEVPASQVTCCSFGGPRLDTLYITTARIDLSDRQLEDEPAAGGLFALRPGATGIADVPFAG